MGIENSKVIDFVGVDSFGREAVLTIADAFKWVPESNYEHIKLLQEKIYSYLDFIDSGEVFEKYPDAKDRKIVIQIVGQYPLNEKAKEFIEAISKITQEEGVSLIFKQHKDH